MEANYHQYFDCVIVNDDLQDSCMDLFTAIQHAQEEPQWIPASWFAPDHPWCTDMHKNKQGNIWMVVINVKELNFEKKQMPLFVIQEKWTFMWTPE